MSHNPDITNDDLNEEIRSDNEDSINFFQGSEIVILHKNISEPVDEETQKMIDGLESLITGFSASIERVKFNKVLTGEDISGIEANGDRSFIMTVIDEVIRFLREVGEWILSLFFNKIARMSNKLRYLENKRKIKGIKTTLVNYRSSINNLYMPTSVTASGIWAVDAARAGLDFYKKTIQAHKALIDAISHTPTSREHLKERKIAVLQMIGGITATGKISKEGFSTRPLPGTKIFNVVTTSTDRNTSPFYFSNLATAAKLKSTEWTPTSSIIDSGLECLKDYITEIKKDQTNTYMLNRNFEKRIKAVRKHADTWTIAYFNWLIEIHRKLISITFQQTTRWYDALEDFISSGLR